MNPPLLQPPVVRRVGLATGLEYQVLEWNEARSEHSVFLLHGFLDVAWTWQWVVAAGLAQRYHVLAPDFRGHGGSAWIGPGGYYHFIDYVADLASLIEQLGRQRVSLVGHSMGGLVATYYAGSYPERVSRLASVEGTSMVDDVTTLPERVPRWIETWRRSQRRQATYYPSMEAAAERLRKYDPWLDERRSLELAQVATKKVDGQGYRFQHDPQHLSVGPMPFKLDIAQSFWRRITCPVLLVDGSHSLALRAPGAAATARQPYFSAAEAKAVVIDAAGHHVQRHQPLELAKLLLEFLG